jgi:hypothetical protein
LKPQCRADWGWQFDSGVCILGLVKEAAVKTLPGNVELQRCSIDPFFFVVAVHLFQAKNLVTKQLLPL